MDQVVLLGGGGHAKVIVELFRAAGCYEVAGCASKDPAAALALGIPVLGDDSRLPAIHASGVRHAFVAIGDNRRRRRLSEEVSRIGFTLVNAISPGAILSPSVRLGAGVAVMAGVVINACSRIGNGCILNTGATVDHDCVIGNWAHIAPGTNLAGCVSVGEGAFLGVGSRAIPKISIGEWATVGAGAVVIRDLPPDVTAVGVPARILGPRR
jgi:UDP-perosamine 4-acetyltransferase